MKRATLALFGLCLAIGCDKTGDGSGAPPSAGSSAPVASAAQPAEPKASAFAGTYRSAWGETVFTQSGGAVNATYPGGTLSCAAKDTALDCKWIEGASSGKASLVKQADGNLQGTWGNGASDSDGGKWTFIPKK